MKPLNDNQISQDVEKLYEIEKIFAIVDSLHFLRGEARKLGNDEVRILIDSTFNILLTTHCMLMRESLCQELEID